MSFVLLIEVAIAEPVSPVLSQASKNILKKFPSWMALYKDSYDQATPSLFIPKTTAGKFVNAIVGHHLDNFDKELDLLKINSFIERADEDQISWIYSANNVNNTFHKIIGNGIELSRVNNIVDFLNSKKTDYVFYHNPINREIITLQDFSTLQARNENQNITTLSQVPVQRFNWFDELGLRVGVTRLYLEENSSFKERILDAFKNPIGIDIDSFKKTLRRELNLWKAFGVQTNSNYVGATPEVLEMSDIVNSTPYFYPDKNPTELFKKFVEELNVKYPNNWGYFKFDESVWDYGGLNNDGIARIPARYYDSSVQIPYYQPGVGDQDDLSLSIRETEATPVFFETYLIAKGKKSTGATPKYYPVNLEFEYYSDYHIKEYDNPTATVNYTLEFHATPHGTYATPVIFYSPFSIYPKNNAVSEKTDISNREWNSYSIFDTEGYTLNNIILKEKNTQKRYKNKKNNIDLNQIHIQDITNLILRLGLWNGAQYASQPQSDSFVVRFSNRSNNTLSYESSTPFLSATPLLSESTTVQAASKLWSLSTKTRETQKQNVSIQINSTEASPPIDYTLDKSAIHSSIIYPIGATPRFTYINNIKPNNEAALGYPNNFSGLSGYGGVTYDPLIRFDVYVPSSPNITVTTVGGSATANQYFSSISYPNNSTPNSITLKLKDGIAYPRQSVNWIPFTSMSTPIVGYVDEYGYVNYVKSDGEFVPSKNSDNIIIPEITRETFGISGASKFEYFFENISIYDPPDINVLLWQEQKIVDPFLNMSYVLKPNQITSIISDPLYASKYIKYPANSIEETYDFNRNTTVFSNFIAKGRLYDQSIEARINAGWIHLGKQDYYLYIKPKKQTFAGKLKEISLSSISQMGAPIYINAYRQGESTPYINYIETAFEDFSTPRQFGFYNKEMLKPSYDDSFYLSYSGIYDASITDSFTGVSLFDNLSSNTNILSINSSTPIFNKNRNYEIIYRVKDSYYVDNILSGSSYYSKIVFDATPSTPLFYDITYETSKYEQSTPVSVSFGETYSLLDSGYVIATSSQYPFKDAQVRISPSIIMDDKKDFMMISIISLDTNNNPKENQRFTLQSNHLNISPSVVQTNADGYAIAKATYSAATPVTGMTKGYLNIKGISSENLSFDKDYLYEIHSGYKQSYSIAVAADPAVVKADAVSSIFIDGIAYKDKKPSENVIIYWRKARSPYSAIEKQSYSSSTNSSGNSGIVTTDANGRFSIGPIVSQDRATPGYWYMVVESSFNNSYLSTATPLAGDIAYWYEAYDNIDINYSPNIKMVDVINFKTEESLDIYSTPSFITSYYNDQLVIPTGSTPRWVPPAWLPIPRYQQYQAGFLGSTPYFISNYINLKKDTQ